MVDSRRWPRVRQKGVECSVEGCDRGCVGNDLCSTHNMALRRYGSVYGKSASKKVCVECGKEFYHKYDRTLYCSQECYASTADYRKKAYEATKRYRARNPVKARIRDRTGKRIARDKTMKRQNCMFCGKLGEAHHFDYKHPLNVVFVCKKHHVMMHALSFV